MLTYKAIQDAALERFNESRRGDCKEWINYALGNIWAMGDWTFKRAIAPVTVTAGSNVLSNLPGDVGVVHLLQNSLGGKLSYKEWDEFNLRYYGAGGDAIPWDYTILGAGPGCQMYVGPISSESNSAYQLLYERERGFYLSTTLTDASPTLPAATINVTSTAGAPTAGQALIAGRMVNYTGTTPTSLTGCSGGAGTFTAGDPLVFLSAIGGELYNDTDVPLSPPETHQLLVHAAQAIGQTGENDYSLYLSDDRVQQGIAAMQARYLITQRGETVQWGDYDRAHFETGGAW